MPLTTGEFQQYYLNPLEKIVKTNTAKALSKNNSSADWRMFFQEGSTKSLYTDTRLEEASGPAKQVGERTPLPIINLNDGLVKRRQVVQYGARAEYSKLVQKTAKKELLARVALMLSSCPNQLISELVASIIELGDQTLSNVPTLNGRPQVDTLAADGNPIFSTDHTFKSDDINSWSNKSSAYLSLTSDTLYDCFEEVNQWRNNVGDLLDVMVDMLIIGTRNEKKATELCVSDTDSETANRSTNAVRRYLGATSFKVYRRMRSPQEWFLRTTAENDFALDWLYHPETKKGFDDQILSFFINLDFALQLGVGDPHRYYAVKM